jgi:hypothetical protein
MLPFYLVGLDLRRGPRQHRAMARRLRAALLVAIAVLYAISIPWYRETELIFGLPDWVALALACYVGVAILNTVAWLLTDVRDAPADDA